MLHGSKKLIGHLKNEFLLSQITDGILKQSKASKGKEDQRKIAEIWLEIIDQRGFS